MNPEVEEVEEIKFKSELRPVEEGMQHYGDIFSDQVECRYTTNQHLRYVHGLWWPVFDEHLTARMKKWSGEVRVYKTDSDGKRSLEYSLKAKSFMSHVIVLPDEDTWKTIKVDYEFEIRIIKQPLKKICYDGMFKKSEENDTAIEIQNKVVFVNKQLLIDNSDYFRCLFSSEFCDYKKPIIRIGLSTFDEFCLLLSTFHPPHEEKIQDHLVEQLLELAERFQMRLATEKIGFHLIRSSAIFHNKKLWLAETYKLAGVIDAILTRIRREDRQHWKYLQYYDELSEETKKKIESWY